MVVDIEELRETGKILYSVSVTQPTGLASASTITDEVISSIKDTDILHSVVGDVLVIRITDLGKLENKVRSECGRECGLTVNVYK